MGTILICKECRGTLPAEAPEGLCPKCLLKVAMGTQPGGAASAAAPQSPSTLPDPARFADYFPQLEVLELLGQGGMGAVYKARQPNLDRLVALKILPGHVGSDPGFAERFAREARALARLNHPNIVAVYDFGQTHGLHYFLMEYVDGLNLRELERSGKLTSRVALQLIPQICDALQYAHDEGVVHRDIKPENVLLDKKGKVKIADFGLARILALEPKDTRLTGVRDVMGTPHYMAPEQVEHPQAVDHRADIYSLGVVFYEMLTGELPLGRFAPPSRKVQVDVRLDEVVLHALEKEPERRYQHASEVKTDVETIARTPQPQVPKPAVDSAAIVPPKQEFWKTAVGALALIVTVLILLGIGALVGVVLIRDSAPSKPDMLVEGTVVNNDTGEPISGARVADNFYAARPNQPPQEAWTDASGRFQLKTWHEEHSIAASAPGHQVTLRTLETKAGSHEHKAQLEFRLQPWVEQAVLNLSSASIVSKGSELQARLGVPGSVDAGAFAVPPVVLGTVPQSGSADVDPGLTQLKVTFSSKMQDQSWSWSTWGEENFPATTGEPRYLPDRRTCILPVKLVPGKLYAIWLNSDSCHNFQDEAGKPAVPYLLIFQTRK